MPDTILSESSTPLRVCYLIDSLGVGGTESQLLMLLRELDRRRVSPYLVLLSGTREESQSMEPTDCPVVRLSIANFHQPSLAVKLWRFVRFLRRKKVDVLQLHFRDSTYFGMIAGKLAGVPRIVLTRRNTGHWLRPLDRFLLRLCQRFSHATLANCEACRKAVIVQERARPDRVHVLFNGIDFARFADISPYEPKLNGAPRRVGVVANLRPVKGIDVFVRSAAMVAETFPNVSFQIAGKGDPAPYRKLAGECGVSDRIEFLGPIEEVPGFLARLDVAVLPSRTEGFSNAILEYMAASRPIVATDVGGNRELIENEKQGLLVASENPLALADAQLRLLNNPELCESFSRAVREKTVAHYSAAAIARQYEDFYRQLMTNSSP
jgi:L-malate glycosyltransferase